MEATGMWVVTDLCHSGGPDRKIDIFCVKKKSGVKTIELPDNRFTKKHEGPRDDIRGELRGKSFNRIGCARE